MGKWFDPHFAAFAAEAEQAFGGKAVVAVLSRWSWLKELTSAAVFTAGGACIPQLAHDEEEVEASGWFGLLELWPDTDDRVLIRRYSVIDDRGSVHAAALAAARTREAIERAMQHCRSLWLDRRRNEARV